MTNLLEHLSTSHDAQQKREADCRNLRLASHPARQTAIEPASFPARQAAEAATRSATTQPATQSILAVAMSAILCFALLPFSAFQPSTALADDGDASSSDAPKTAYQLQQDIESAQAAYTEARDKADDAASRVAEHEEKIADIEENLLPEQQERTGKATRELYKLQQSSVSLVDVLLNAGSLRDFITHFEYIAHITDKHRGEIERLVSMKDELKSSRTELREAQEEADAKASEAEAALDAAKEAQAEAQRRVEEEALMQAQIAANAAAMAEEQRNNDAPSAQTPSSSNGDANSGGNSGSNSGEGSGSGSGGQNPDQGGSGGSGDSGSGNSGSIQPPPPENDTLAGWAARIDAYLAGSPMAGQGTTFASAALSYGVDPRFSPAIACAESGKGSFCFLPHNAWGWGSCSWDSWEEAINDHVRGLASIYGFSPTIEGAQMYCPPNWQHWYNMVCSQMALI